VVILHFIDIPKQRLTPRCAPDLPGGYLKLSHFSRRRDRAERLTIDPRYLTIDPRYLIK
jgi:hypothetical protein